MARGASGRAPAPLSVEAALSEARAARQMVCRCFSAAEPEFGERAAALGLAGVWTLAVSTDRLLLSLQRLFWHPRFSAETAARLAASPPRCRGGWELGSGCSEAARWLGSEALGLLGKAPPELFGWRHKCRWFRCRWCGSPRFSLALGFSGTFPSGRCCASLLPSPAREPRFLPRPLAWSSDLPAWGRLKGWVPGNCPRSWSQGLRQEHEDGERCWDAPRALTTWDVRPRFSLQGILGQQ